MSAELYVATNDGELENPIFQFLKCVDLITTFGLWNVGPRRESKWHDGNDQRVEKDILRIQILEEINSSSKELLHYCKNGNGDCGENKSF
jgi:hypothetical protein